jgi:hypothetical protein
MPTVSRICLLHQCTTTTAATAMAIGFDVVEIFVIVMGRGLTGSLWLLLLLHTLRRLETRAFASLILLYLRIQMGIIQHGEYLAEHVLSLVAACRIVSAGKSIQILRTNEPLNKTRDFSAKLPSVVDKKQQQSSTLIR